MSLKNDTIKLLHTLKEGKSVAEPRRFILTERQYKHMVEKYPDGFTIFDCFREGVYPLGTT